MVCLLNEGELEGRIDVLQHARALDFLVHQTGFITVHDPHFKSGDPEVRDRKGQSVAFVNCRAIIGMVLASEVVTHELMAEPELAAAKS